MCEGEGERERESKKKVAERNKEKKGPRGSFQMIEFAIRCSFDAEPKSSSPFYNIQYNKQLGTLSLSLSLSLSLAD